MFDGNLSEMREKERNRKRKRKEKKKVELNKRNINLDTHTWQTCGPLFIQLFQLL